jgi:hypothetical protein
VASHPVARDGTPQHLTYDVTLSEDTRTCAGDSYPGVAEGATVERVTFDPWAHARFMTAENKQRVLRTVAEYRRSHGGDFPPMEYLLVHTELSWNTIRILSQRLVDEGRLESFPDEPMPDEP